MTNPASSALTLGDLLAQQEFGLKLLTVGESAHHRSIHGAHAIEISHPTRWLAEGWVMLTNGQRLRSHPTEQRELVVELTDAGITALGFGIEMISKRVPKALLQEAERRSFPVFAVPPPLAFRDIISFVNQSVLSTDLFLLQRVMSVQSYLMDAFHDDPPEPAVVRRLASVLRGVDVALVECDGYVTAQTAPSAVAARAMVQPASNLQEIEYQGRWGVASRVDRGSQPGAWLIVLAPDDEASRQLVKPVTRAAARLLGVPSLARDSSSWRRRRRRRMAEVMYDGGADAQRARFLGSLAEAGLDFTSSCRVALIAEVAGGAARR